MDVFVQFGRSGVCSAKVMPVWLLFGVLPGVAFGNAPSPSICEWDASCQSVPGFGYPTLGFLFFAAAALIVVAMIHLLLKCCSLCSGSCEEWKKESSLKLVDEKWFHYFSLQVVSWFIVVVMESWSGGWVALQHNVVAYLSVHVGSMFGAGGVMDPCRRTSLCFHLVMCAIISSLGFTLLCGHVLGLRQPQVAAAYFGASVGFLALVGVLAYAFEGLGVRQGSRFAFEQAKATPRVDVAETPQASPFLEAQGKTFIQSGPSLVSSRSLLVRALTGRTLVVRLSSTDDVLHCVSERTGIPLHAFYLTLNGKCLTEDTLRSMDLSSPIPLVMCSRLLGGVPTSVPGDWVCSRCHISGCWPTKSRCFRCGAPRDSASQDVGPSLPRRENSHPGRAPKPKPAPVNPSFREPRVVPPKKSGTPPAASAPTAPSAASQLDPTAIVTLLRSLGLSEELLSQVRAAFPPPPAQNPKKEQKLLQLRGQIDAAKKHVERLERSVTHHRSQLHVCMENKSVKEAEVAKLENEYRLLTDFKLSPNATPAASAHVSPAHSVCESEGENAMDLEGTHPVPPCASAFSGVCCSHWFSGLA